jgi:hypothetical protein
MAWAELAGRVRFLGNVFGPPCFDGRILMQIFQLSANMNETRFKNGREASNDVSKNDVSKNDVSKNDASKNDTF